MMLREDMMPDAYYYYAPRCYTLLMLMILHYADITLRADYATLRHAMPLAAIFPLLDMVARRLRCHYC